MVDKYGFPRSKPKKHKSGLCPVHGFKTGDFVKATILKGKNKGLHYGFVAVRKTGPFYITTSSKKVSTNYKNCNLLKHFEGYTWVMKFESACG